MDHIIQLNSVCLGPGEGWVLDWLRCMQELLVLVHGSARVKLLPYLIYSDKTVITLGGKSFHPVLITLALPGKHGRGQFAHQRIAMLPVLNPADFELAANSPQ